MAWTTGEILVFFVFIILLSLITAWLVRRITGGTLRYRSEREGMKVGKVYRSASEKKKIRK